MISKRFARVIIGLVAGVSALFIWAATRLEFNYDFESYFPEDDADMSFYLDYIEDFRNDNDYLLLGLYNEQGIFEQDFLQKVDRLTQGLDTLYNVTAVQSPTKLSYLVMGPLGPISVRYLHPDQPERYAADSARIYADSTLVGTLFAPGGHAVRLVVENQEMIKKPAADSLNADVTALLDQLQFDRYHYSGKAKAQDVYINKMQWELALFFSLSVVLVVVFLWLAYRAAWGVFVPLVVVALAVVWCLGLVVATGEKVDLLMVLLPTILFVVGMSDVVHILTRYLEELRNKVPKREAMRRTFREVGLATLLTSVTTAVGFFTLLTASIRPIRTFGLYTGLGVFLAYILAFSLLPAVLVLTKPPKAVDNWRQRQLWRRRLGGAFRWVLGHRPLVVWAGVVITAVSLVGLSQVRVNSLLIEDLPKNAPLRQDFTFFDTYFGGSRPFEMSVKVIPEGATVLDSAALVQMDRLNSYLRQEFGVGGLSSPVYLAKSLNRALQGGRQAAFALPDTPAGWQRVDRLLQRSAASPALRNLVNDSLNHARIGGFIPDTGSAMYMEKYARLYQAIPQLVDTTYLQVTPTGTSLLIDKNNQELSADMLKGLTIAFAVIALIAGLMFRSFRMVLIALLPNIIPIVMVAGIMGYFQIPLKLSTSIIFTIAFGIAVDDTIHFLSKFRLEVGKGKSLLYALKSTYMSTGKAIVVTTVILSGGFLTLMLSSFGGTFFTGLLVSLTLLFAMTIDLTLLPVLLLLFYRPPRV